MSRREIGKELLITELNFPTHLFKLRCGRAREWDEGYSSLKSTFLITLSYSGVGKNAMGITHK